MIQLVTVGVAASDADWKVRESQGSNLSPRIREYVANLDPPMDPGIPYCAAAIQKWSDVAAWALGVDNPLDAVRYEALVQSYYDALAPQGLVNRDLVEPGDLILFRFPQGPDRWNHIGIVAQAPNEDGVAWTIEANTSIGVGVDDDEAAQREGDGVFAKPREIAPGYPVCFLRWHVAGNWAL